MGRVSIVLCKEIENWLGSKPRSFNFSDYVRTLIMDNIQEEKNNEVKKHGGRAIDINIPNRQR